MEVGEGEASGSDVIGDEEWVEVDRGGGGCGEVRDGCVAWDEQGGCYGNEVCCGGGG